LNAVLPPLLFASVAVAVFVPALASPRAIEYVHVRSLPPAIV
jgi:hypothetical protein